MNTARSVSELYTETLQWTKENKKVVSVSLLVTILLTLTTITYATRDVPKPITQVQIELKNKQMQALSTFGTVIKKVNYRLQPSTTSDIAGELTPNEKIAITGIKDEGSMTWVQFTKDDCIYYACMKMKLAEETQYIQILKN